MPLTDLPWWRWRARLRSALHMLSDPSFQQEAWLGGLDGYGDVTDAVYRLVEDTWLDRWYTSLIGEQWLLVVVFDKQTHVGLVKVLARKAADELERVLERVRGTGAQAREAVVNVQFRSSVENTIDLLFQD